MKTLRSFILVFVICTDQNRCTAGLWTALSHRICENVSVEWKRGSCLENDAFVWKMSVGGSLNWLLKDGTSWSSNYLGPWQYLNLKRGNHIFTLKKILSKINLTVWVFFHWLCLWQSSSGRSIISQLIYTSDTLDFNSGTVCPNDSAYT